jgi:hypothetical protein
LQLHEFASIAQPRTNTINRRPPQFKRFGCDNLQYLAIAQGRVTMRAFNRFLVFSALVCSASNVGAALVQRDFSMSGDNLVTFDSTSNLEWLDVSVTVGMSYQAVLGSSYVTTYGFRYATGAELIALYDHAGGDGSYYVPRTPDGNVNGVPSAGNYDAASLLIAIMGCTSDVLGQLCDQAEQDWHIGMYGPEVVGAMQSASIVDAFNAPDSRAGTAAMWLDFSDTVPGRAQTDQGSYLVRAVPVPATVWLFGSGLVWLYGMSRKRRRN